MKKKTKKYFSKKHVKFLLPHNHNKKIETERKSFLLSPSDLYTVWNEKLEYLKAKIHEYKQQKQEKRMLNFK